MWGDAETQRQARRQLLRQPALVIEILELKSTGTGSQRGAGTCPVLPSERRNGTTCVRVPPTPPRPRPGLRTGCRTVSAAPADPGGPTPRSDRLPEAERSGGTGPPTPSADGQPPSTPAGSSRQGSSRPARAAHGPHRAPAPDPLTHLPANMAAPPASAERSLARPPPPRPALPARSMARSSATRAAIRRRPRRSPAQRPFQARVRRHVNKPPSAAPEGTGRGPGPPPPGRPRAAPAGH